MSPMGAREHALLRFRDAGLSEQVVVAAFVGGSVAAHTDDEVSDLDLYAVTLEPEYEQFFSRRHAFMRTWARPLLMVDTLDFEGLAFDMLHLVPGRRRVRRTGSRSYREFPCNARRSTCSPRQQDCAAQRRQLFKARPDPL